MPTASQCLANPGSRSITYAETVYPAYLWLEQHSNCVKKMPTLDCDCHIR